jgi:non-specific serine/threonine protein kinase
MNYVAAVPLDGWSDGVRSHATSWWPTIGRGATAEVPAVSLLHAMPVEEIRAVETEPVRPDQLAAAGWLHNLPQPLTSFVGREREVAEISKLLPSARLVTLTGTGGVGKTRLGHEVAARMLAPAESGEPAFPGGVWIVELASLTEPTQVPQAVAAVLDVREEADCSLMASVAAALRPERLLLVLDNCEHLVDACASIADMLLRTCPDLAILATSRQALGIAGETTFCVPSLSLSSRWDTLTTSAQSPEAACQPEASAGAMPKPVELAMPSEAVRLFVERARAVVPSFALTERNVSAVELICRRLDGLPLAIELAAARVAVLTPDQIEARLDDRFRLLSGGSRTALPRYRTLRALIDWSHDLLDEQERALLRRLAVFAGGWTLEAAESVCSGDGLEPDEILDLLSGLVAKSLVTTTESADEVRYGFLELVRAYVGEKLTESGEEATLRERHCAWYLALTEQAEPCLTGAFTVSWLDRLERERENLRAVLTWCVDRGDAEAGLRLSGALTRFWLVRGSQRETRGTLAELLALTPAASASAVSLTARTKALFAAGRLDLHQEDRVSAESRYQEALIASRELGDRRGEATALYSIGHVARVRGDYGAARGRFEESRQIFAALGDRYWLAQVQHELGVVAFYEGDLGTARAHYEACLTVYKALGDEPGIVSALDDLGEVAFQQGDLVKARTLLRTALEMARRIDDKTRIAMVLVTLAGMAAVEGKPTRAVRLAAAASGLNDRADRRRSPAWHAMVARWLAPAYKALRPDDVAAIEAAGRVMALDEAIEYALAFDAPVAVGIVSDGPSIERPAVAPVVEISAPKARELKPAVRGGSRLVPRLADASAASGAGRDTSAMPWRAVSELTSREREVAALVAQGMTNRQIAAELVITEGTAANHVKHILARLVLDSRVQIAGWAIENGLTRARAG